MSKDNKNVENFMFYIKKHKKNPGFQHTQCGKG